MDSSFSTRSRPDRDIRTPRLLLRQWRDGDLEPFAAMNADLEVMRYFPAPLGRLESDAFAGRIRAQLTSGWGLWAVAVREAGHPLHGRFIGFTGLVWQDFPAAFTPALEIGWRLARHAWGQGFATEAARAVLDVAFSEYAEGGGGDGRGDGLGADEVVSMTAVDNLPSRAVMERLGMTRDPSDDFDHPRVPEGSPLRRHVLYRLRPEHHRAAWPATAPH